MGRPRGFDEDAVVRAAVGIFAGRPYDGISVDELVSALAVHRNSLYKTFGSKRGLYLAALRWHLREQVGPVIDHIGAAPDLTEAIRRALAAGAGFDLLLMATLERAPVDEEVAADVHRSWDALDRALDRPGPGPSDRPDAATAVDPDRAVGLALSATVAGLRLRQRAGTLPARTGAAAAALIGRLDRHHH